jgi:hypothetical protein
MRILKVKDLLALLKQTAACKVAKIWPCKPMCEIRLYGLLKKLDTNVSQLAADDCLFGFAL